MAYAFVKNVFNIKNENGTVDEFIKISTLSEFNLYEFIMKIQLLKTENFFQYNTCIDLNDILNSNVEQINAELIAIITEYMFLGDISFNVSADITKGTIVIDLTITLNEKIHETTNLTTSLSL